MKNPESMFIAIEGGDGSGKGTQTTMLNEAVIKRGHNVLKLSFPQYGKPSARRVERYLNGKYGEDAQSLHPDLTSLPFAIDRYAAAPEIRDFLKTPGNIVLSDRYVFSNLAHNGAKLDDTEERRQFYNESLELEFDLLGIPRPDINFLLLLPPDIAQSNVDKKAARGYTDRKRDIHEANYHHQELALRAYIELSELYPEAFIAIQCLSRSGKMRSPDDIHAEILSHVENQLKNSTEVE